MKKKLLWTAVMAVFSCVGMFAGTGTVSDPYTCAEAIAIGKDIPADTYVYGYIVGGRYDDFDCTSNEYGISIADDISETNLENCFQVKLSTDQRPIWHPKNDSTKLGEFVLVSGSGDGYGGYPAVEYDVAIELYTTSAPELLLGTGTASSPYTCAQAIAIGKDIPEGTYVHGYIVGGRYDDFDYNSNEYGISIADDVSETDVNNCFQVKLSTDQRPIWHPMNDSTKLGELILVSGSGDGYGGYSAVEYDVTIESYTVPVSGTPVFADILPLSGSIYMLNEEFTISATATTDATDGIDSVLIIYGTDTAKMTTADSVYSYDVSFVATGVVSVKMIAYGANGEMTTSASIELVVSEYALNIMSKADYQIIVDTVNARGDNTNAYPDNSDDYYGTSAYYSNFSVGDGSYNAIFATADQAIEEALSTIFLPAVRSNAVVNDTVEVQYAMYGGDEPEGSMVFVCISTSPLTFVKEGSTPSSIVELETISSVFGSKGLINIEIEGVKFVTIYDFSGRIYATQLVQDNAAISISAGAYIVKVGNEVTKIVVQ